MATNWVKCTHKGDENLIYVNIDSAMSIRWIESDKATIIAFPGGEIARLALSVRENMQSALRLLRHPDVQQASLFLDFVGALIGIPDARIGT